MRRAREYRWSAFPCIALSKLRLRDHQPKDHHHRTKTRDTEYEPAAIQRVVPGRQRLVTRLRRSRQIAHFDLRKDHGYPEQAGDDIEAERGGEPALGPCHR